jgi:hypothetical protein
MNELVEQKKKSIWRRVKARWGVTTWGVVAILLSFSLAGSTVLKVSRPILGFVLPAGVPRWIWWTARIVIIVPVYQMLLLAYGTILGQFRFFWEREKKMAGWIARPFSRRA